MLVSVRHSCGARMSLTAFVLAVAVGPHIFLPEVGVLSTVPVPLVTPDGSLTSAQQMFTEWMTEPPTSLLLLKIL